VVENSFYFPYFNIVKNSKKEKPIFQNMEANMIQEK